ncbi:hypothetical protein NUW54_g1030 [Trametes sanguinea]|uniref:Uncharacterized protein n=1 Tax=Trametes sanguinea TaxID=158606 RepID=A0ACC1Q7R5_9APHY|nr:hypothetical protein NUW54_g1030 [Trametes sanguinea]
MLEQESEQYRQALEDELQQMKLDEKTAQEAVSTEARMTAQASNSREDAQNNIAAVVQPLLELLREHTGYYLTLFAGIPLSSGKEEFKMKIITAGKTAGSPGLPWHMCEPEPFKSQVVASFTRFLMKTPEWAQRVANTSDSPTHPLSINLSHAGPPDRGLPPLLCPALQYGLEGLSRLGHAERKRLAECARELSRWGGPSSSHLLCGFIGPPRPGDSTVPWHPA